MFQHRIDVKIWIWERKKFKDLVYAKTKYSLKSSSNDSSGNCKSFYLLNLLRNNKLYEALKKNDLIMLS